jgi:hypothetical protein
MQDRLPQPLVVFVKRSLQWLALTQFALVLSLIVGTAQDKVSLDKRRLLALQGTVVVEDCHALLCPYKSHSAWLRCHRDKFA